MGRATSISKISLHSFLFQSTPSVGRATFVVPVAVGAQLFQSTPSVGRATAGRQEYSRDISISIHALRGEGDSPAPKLRGSDGHFNPRPPWGGRQQSGAYMTASLNFNPRPPWGGRQATLKRVYKYPSFQSTPSVGRATAIQ